jgi:hypothetical protein
MKRKTITNAIMHVPIDALSKYPLDQLFELLARATAELETAKRTKEWLEFAISLKYQRSNHTKRLHAGRSISIMHFRNHGDYKPTKLRQKQNKLVLNRNNYKDK